VHQSAFGDSLSRLGGHTSIQWGAWRAGCNAKTKIVVSNLTTNINVCGTSGPPGSAPGQVVIK